MSLVGRLVAAIALVLLSTPSWAQLSYFVLIDADNDVATGCAATLPAAGTLTGIERRLTATVSETSPLQVTQLTLESCTGSGFAAPVSLPGTPYPVGLNNGVGGTDVIEQAVDARAIAAPGTTVRLYFAAQGPAGSDLLGLANDPPIVFYIQFGPVDIPLLSGGGFLVLALLLLVIVFRQRSRFPAGMTVVVLVGVLAGVAWAAGFRLDGQVGDWQGVSAIGSDAPGDSASNTDIITVFAAQEGGNLFFRIDIANAEAPPSPNQPPVFTSTPITTASVGNPYVYNITAVDPDGNGLSFAAPRLPAWLSLADNGDGTARLSGTPAAANLGDNPVELEVTDNGSPKLSANQSFAIKVSAEPPTNQPPALDLNGSAPGIDFTAVFTEDRGRVAIVDPANLTVTDPDSPNLVSATVTLINLLDTGQEILAVNPATVEPNTPIAVNYNTSTAGRGVLTLSGTATLAQYQAALRTVTYNNASANPTPTARTITFIGSDGTSNSATATTTLSVTPVNDAPVANGQSVSTPEDTAVTIILTGSDPDGDSLTFAIATAPTNGTLGAVTSLTASSASVTFTPKAGFNGADSFSFTVSDGTVGSTPATVSVSVGAANDPPTANNQSVGTPEDTAVTITLTGSDPDGDSLAFAIATGPANGTLGAITPLTATSASVVYTPAPNVTGPDSFTFTVNDGAATSAPATVTITVGVINDPPVLDLDGAADDPGGDINFSATFAEDAGPLPIVDPVNLTLTDPDSAALARTTITLINRPDGAVEALAANTAGTAITASFNAASGVLLLTGPDSVANFQTVLRTVRYNNSSQNPDPADRSVNFVVNDGIDDSAPATATVAVNSVNDPPGFTRGPDQAVNEDAGAQTVAGWATAISDGDGDGGTQTLTFNVTGNSNLGLFATGPAVGSNGTLTYTPAPNANGSATITLTLADNGGTANGGVDTSAPQSFAITVNPVNDAPSFIRGADQNVSGTAGPQSVPWATGISAGPADEAGQTLNFNITGNTNPALFSAGPAISPTGVLSYTPVNTSGSAILTVTLQDNGGTANGGIDTSAPQTFTITVNAVNAPPNAAADTASTDEDTALPMIAVLGNDTDPDGPPPLTIASVNTAGTLGRVTNNGTSVAYDPNGQFETLNVGDTATDSFGYTACDSFAPPACSTATVTVTIDGANDAPVLDLNGSAADINFAAIFTEGRGAVAVVDAANLSVADVDNPDLSSATITLTNLLDVGVETLAINTGAFPNISANYNPATGVLALSTVTAQPLADFQAVLRTVTYNNTSPDPDTTARVIQFVANDGTANSAVATSTVTINAVNTAPSFTKGPDQTVNQNAGAQTVNPWATAINDGDGGAQTLTFNITDNTNPNLFSAGPAVSSTGVLTYTPAATASGTAAITLTLSDDGGTANGGVDTSAPQTFNITVNAINDAPSFTAGPDQTVNEDAGAQTVNPWATGISAGPPDETGQTLTFNIIGNTNPGLFSAGPAITSAGVLTYAPAPDAFGTATITVTLQDNGGTANGGVDTSAPQTFTITVNSVNDAPSFTKGPDQTVLEDAGARTVAGWATGISAGPANEAGQTLTFAVTSNTNAGLFSAGPAVAANGTLTYTPAANANGTATITLVLQDNGGTADGGVDTSAAQTFTITVTPVNDPPVVTAPGPYAVLGNVAISVPAPGLLTTVSDPADGAGAAPFTISSAAITSTQGGSVTIDTGTGAFTYNPPAGYDGVDSFTYQVCDSGVPGSACATATVTLNISGMIWFIDNAAAACTTRATGCGRLSNPYSTLAAFQAENNGAGNNPAAGDNIFLYRNTATNYTGPLTLLNSQKLIGQGATASLSAITGLTPPPFSAALPATGGTRPVIAHNANNFTLAQGNLLRGFNLSNTGGTALVGTNFGNLITSEVSVSNTGGVAINLNNGNPTASFTSVSASGGANGISLQNTTGSFTVTGTGAADSGGTIQNTTGADNTTNGIGVYLSSAQNVSLNWMRISNHPNFAIRGDNVTNFAMDRVVVSGANGNNAAATPREASVLFNGLFGTSSMTNSTISGGIEDNIRIENTTATPLNSLTVSGSGGTSSTCQILNNSTVSGNIGFRLAGFNNANMTVTVTGCLFRGNRTDAINIDAANTSTVTSTVTNNTIIAGTGGANQGNLGINVTSGATGQHNYTVSNNQVGTDGATPAPLLNTGINLFSGNGSTLGSTSIGFVQSNTVRNAETGSGHGIQIFQDLTSTLRTNVNANSISNVALDFGLRVEGAGDPNGAGGSIQAGVTNNNVSVLPSALDSIRVRSRRQIALCSEIRANTTNVGGSGFFGIFTNQANTSTFSIEGLALGAQTAAAAQTYLGGQNPAAATISATAATNYTGVAANTCAIP